MLLEMPVVPAHCIVIDYKQGGAVSIGQLAKMRFNRFH
jgi:hypothetical protein